MSSTILARFTSFTYVDPDISTGALDLIYGDLLLDFVYLSSVSAPNTGLKLVFIKVPIGY